MRTFFARLRVSGRSLIGVSTSVRKAETPRRAGEEPPAARVHLTSTAGDTLIEVLISALLVGLIVVGTFSGLNSANRSTSIDRARSQADALAEQNEEQLHSLSITALKKLEEKPETKPVMQNGTKYEVTSEANLVLDNTATTSCSSTALSAEYIRTTSTVYPTTKAAFGATKPVVETGIVSPPPHTSLVVQVTNQMAEPVAGMEAHVAGPSTATAVTNTNGCAVLALEPGEYEVNVHLAGYVDPNWFTESKNDTSLSPASIYLPAQTTTKKEYRFAPAARITSLEFEELNPVTNTKKPAKVVNAILESTGMAPSTRLLEPEGGGYLSSIATTKHIYPFVSGYTAYAGTCTANRPPEEKERTSIVFPENGEVTKKLLPLPSLVVDVWKGTSASKATLVSTAPEIFLSDTDENCEHTYHQAETVAPTPEGGALKYPGQPWGTYIACVNVTYSGQKKHYSSPETKNNHPEQKGTVVNLYEGGSTGEGLVEGSCP